MLNIITKNRLLILQLTGDLDIIQSNEFLSYVEKQRDSFDAILIDMKQVDYLSSTGIGVLLHIYKKKLKIGIIVTKGSQVETMLTLQNLEKVLDIFNSEEQALCYLKDFITPSILKKKEDK